MTVRIAGFVCEHVGLLWLLLLAACASSQFLPFNFSNFSIPMPSTLLCEPRTWNATAASSAVSLSWCQYDNAFILSDFLSRNSTDLTTSVSADESSGSSESGSFQLHIECDGELITDDEFINGSIDSIYRRCTGIQSIQAGSVGILNATTSMFLNLTNFIMFVDASGQLLFVYFNNNTMANRMKLDISNVNNFDTTNIQYNVHTPSNRPWWLNNTAPRPHSLGRLNTTENLIIQDTVLWLTNSSSASLIGISGIDGQLTEPCVIFSYPESQVVGAELSLHSAAFFPHRANSTDEIISAGWVTTANYSKELRVFFNITDPPAWSAEWFTYQFNAVPTTQSAVRDFINFCPGDTPLGINFYVRLFALSPATLSTAHNRVSNMSFVVANTRRGVALFRIGYFGENNTYMYYGEERVQYIRNMTLIPDWCEPTTVFDPLSNEEILAPRQPSTVFCVPDSGTVIDNVEVLSADSFTNIGTYSRDMWLIISMSNATNSFLHVMSLTELIFVPEDESTFLNPLGLPPSYGTAAFPCNFDTEVYFINATSGLPSCGLRIVADYVLPQNDPVTDVVSRVIARRSATTTGNATGKNESNFANVGGLGPNTDEYSLVFASQGQSVSVFAMFPINSHTNASFALGFQLYNNILFLGNISNMYVSENGMHLLTAVSRHAWELESQTRYNDICNALASDPSNVFLQSFSSACAQMPPQQVNLNAFTQYASYCAFNLYCPSLDQMEFGMPPDRYYAERPAVAKLCPVGYFCVGGQKVECPQGFYCDEPGLMTPKRCANPVNSMTTCAAQGLVAPMACPLGTVCTLPHIPGLPAPPGFMVPTAPGQRTAFIACPPGYWCPLGAQEATPNTTFTNTTFICPANTYCSHSGTLEPVACECTSNSSTSGALSIITANGTNLDCNGETLYCPAGSADVSFCPAGFYCTMPNQSVECIQTQYCPPGTFAPQLCPAGRFCPTPALPLMCPSGHYCPEGSVFPSECNFLTVCPAGSSAQSRSLLVLFVLFAVVAGVLIGFCLFTRWDRKRQEQDAAVHVLSAEAREYLTKGDFGDDDTVYESSVSSRPKAAASSTDEDALNEPIIKSAESAQQDAQPSTYKQQLSIPTSRFQTPTIRFDGMGLRLEVGEAKGKLVLDNVTGTIPPGSFVAVMGPSGSGKSTFMHTLAGKAFYGTRLGHVYINNDEVDLNKFSKTVGFVKQDDIMLREMTVAETLLFNARMRYDPLSVDTPEAISNAMLTALDLNHVRGTNIGDEKKRGISGGQRKRVNIGMELVALPSILFLDEPTSGLDSSSSMSVCSALREMANVGVTVIAVIHQPRYEIFNMFHKVLLLAKGGKLVYYGAPTDAMNYFENVIGIPCPPHVNPPDFFMDVISGETNAAGLSIDEMVKKWNEFSGGVLPPGLNQEQQTVVSSITSRRSELTISTDGRDDEVGGFILAQQAANKQIAGVFRQLVLFTMRAVVQTSRDLIWFFTDLMLVFVAGFFLGLVFSDSEYRPPLPDQIVNRSLAAFGNSPPPMLAEFFERPVDDPIISEASLTCMAIGMTGITAALRVFGNEQIVYWREASAGMSTTAYFLAKNINHIFFIILSPLLYLAPFLTFVNARASFFAYYRVLVVTQFTTTGLGYLISIVVPGGLAQLAGVVVVLVFSMFGGSRPTLVEIKNMFVLLQAMPYTSYIRFAQEALYLEEITAWEPIVNIQPSLNLFDYALDDYQMCMAATFAFGIGFRILALIAMTVLHRDQKH